jgi:phage minor structural protein
MGEYIKIYDNILDLQAICEKAFNICYKSILNEIWTAEFSLPADDPKNDECIAFRCIELFDSSGERIDLFRILPNTLQKNTSGSVITYQCEHVLATLLDSVLFQYHQIGGTGVYTDEILEYILSQQTSEKWQLGTCDFTRQFQYNFENENLLAALFSVPKPFNQKYQWTWNTLTTPWTLNLIELNEAANPTSYLRHKKNMKSITKEVDNTQLCTRLYALGFGEGVNQLTIEDENDGIPYIDSDNQDTYGIITRIWVDRRYESAETLKAAAETLLSELEEPRITYKAEAAELYSLTGRTADKFTPGDIIKVIDNDLDISYNAFVISTTRRNIDSEPWNCQLEISNKAEDIAGSIAALADRQRINEVYSQGATNIDTHDFADNADASHPATLRFYIPDETVKINKALLSWRVEAFRAYSTTVAAGGSTATTTGSGGATATTTAGGGGTTVASAGGGATTPTSGPINETSVWSDSGYPNAGWAGLAYDTSGFQPAYSGSEDGTLGYHSHVLDNHQHILSISHAHLLTANAHTHNISIGNHAHSVSIGNHTHSISIGNHTHSVTIGTHTHSIQYGIYEGATPTSLNITVDGNNTGLTATSGSQDVINYLDVDGGGKITRGAWHEITITPNSMGRIVANLIIQFFVQSRGTETL